MHLDQVIEQVIANVHQHCQQSQGYEEGPWVNPMTPVDPVAALAVAKSLIDQDAFDVCVSVAPEGHVYGYFFEKLGARVLSVHVDYPPRRCQVLDDLAGLRGARVLILEDDVVSGVTLRLVTDVLRDWEPRSLSLYLGRPKEGQILENIGPEIQSVYLAEDLFDSADRERHQREFVEFFSKRQ